VPAILLGGGESHHLGRDRTRNRSASSVGNDLWHDLKPSFGDLGEISLACEAETALHGRTLLAGDAEGRRIEFPAGVRPEEWTARPPNELGRRRFLNAGYPSSATPAADTEGKHKVSQLPSTPLAMTVWLIGGSPIAGDKNRLAAREPSPERVAFGSLAGPISGCHDAQV
jgi:hypothetical protein